MILGFSTQINNKPTNFIEKITRCILMNKKHTGWEFDYDICFVDIFNLPDYAPKLHTIREDKTDRWQAGTMIDFFINVRKKDMFRFAPRIPVVSTQTVYMSYRYNDLIQITVGEKELFGHERVEFAQNDGFDTWEDFFDYFYPQISATPDDFLKMKLIHWTDKKY